MNRIYMNYMTSTYHKFIKSYESKSQMQPEFSESIRKLYEKKDDWPAGRIEKPSEEISGEMTMEEYRQYIYDKIYCMQMHSSQMKNSVSVYISDEGFCAMKNDPEYEAWVLETLRKDFNYYNPWGAMGSGSYIVHFFGATKEEYRGQSWSKGDGFSKNTEESYWERRKERKKQLQEEYKLLLEKKALIRRIQQQLFNEKDISWAEAAWEAKKMVH